MATRGDKSTAKKTPAKRATKPRAKSSARKRTSAASKKASPKRTATKHASASSSTRKKAATATDTNKFTTQKKFKPEAVALPTNMSQRAITKSLTYKTYFRKYATAGLFGFGLVCVLAGAAMSLHTSFNSDRALHVANVCLSGDCSDILITDLETTKNTTALPAVEDTVPKVTSAPATATLKDEVPRTPVEDFSLTVLTTNTAKLKLFLRDLDGQRFALAPVKKTTGVYTAAVPVKELRPSTYRIRAEATAPDGVVQLVTLGLFTVENAPAPTEAAAETDPTLNDSSSAVNTTTQTEEAVAEVEDVVGTEANQNPSLNISIQSDTTRKVIPIQISTNTELLRVSFYVRKKLGLSPELASTARFLDGAWRYAFDKSEWPAGNYELFARATTKAGESLQSNDVTIVVESSPVMEPVIDRTSEIEISGTETVDSTEDSVVTVDENQTIDQQLPKREPIVRTFATSSFSTLGSEADPVPDSSATVVARRLLVEYESQLANLLQRYAIAVQGKETSIIELARKRVLSLKTEMMTGLLKSSDETLINQVDSILTQEFEQLLQRTDEFEDARRERAEAGDSVSTDSDNDGISDFDEINVYGTDPNAADTDQDGYLDGVEVISGFDPRDSSGESIITYESPKDTVRPVRSDVLVVSSVQPVVETDTEIKQASVQAKITGTAIPNSFVTLYIFSTPIIVTVKTDAAGAYEYILEKELADGSHEVYAAVTDNAGTIVARSLPFSFVKEAQAFTPAANASEVKLATAPAEVVTNQMLGTTLGLAALAFGLLLLILGMSVRGRDPLDDASVPAGV